MWYLFGDDDVWVVVRVNIHTKDIHSIVASTVIVVEYVGNADTINEIIGRH